MSFGRLVRWGAISSLLGGVAWCALSLESIARPDPERYRTGLFLVPWVLSARGIVALHALQHRQAGRLGRIGFWTTISSMLAAAMGTIAYLAGVHALRWLEALGIVGWTVGMLLLGFATARARVVAARTGIALMLAEPATVVTAVALSPWMPLQSEGSYSGAIANGIVFLMLGVALRSRRTGMASPSMRAGEVGMTA
ncbi:MAG: hypothetical protein M3Q03_16150 [Chloroflexota bacterium]|nr:hypothetical protein [Chloroflexota bacterium]